MERGTADKGRFFPSDGNRPLGRCQLPPPAQYAPSDGSGRCKTILERRAAPGRGTLAPLCRPRAVARPCSRSRRRGITSDPVPMPMPMAPDHIRSSAAPMLKAPGHIRPGAASMPPALGHNRPRATSMAPQGHADGGLASAGPSVPMTTAPVPACVSRSLQEFLPRVPATPRTYPVHPAIQVPIRPPPATAGTGFPRQRHSRAPPTAAGRKPTLVRGQRGREVRRTVPG